MKNNLLHKQLALRASFFLLLWAAGMTKAFAFYDFSQACATGQTLYYTITDATNHYVEISCPGDPNGSGCWTGFTQPTGDITLPSSVTYGGITYTVTSIGNSAFYHCDGMTGSLTIPNTVTLIDDYAFSSCSGFTGSLTIQNSVTAIGLWAFSQCSGFTGSLTIPSTLTTIGNRAFYICSGFTSISSLAVIPPSLGSYVFNGVNTDIPVMVPCGAEDNYSAASGWSTFMHIQGLCSMALLKIDAEHNPDPDDPNSPYMRVLWGVEDFESGMPSLPIWLNDGVYPWEITETNPYEGTYCIKSGNAGVNSSTSTMQLILDMPADGQISFFTRISSENGYDFGCFYIDDEQQNCLTGLSSSWVENGYALSAGIHILKWDFSKDSSMSSGDDCLYVDRISVNVGSGTTDLYRAHSDGSGWEWVADVSGIEYIDTDWEGLEMGFYKYGVVAEGSTLDEAFWSNSIEHPYVDPLTYAINSDGVSVTVTGHRDGTAATGSITIPETKTIGGVTYTVTAIGNHAFAGCSGFTGDLTIPNSVTTIEDEAFRSCTGFTGSLTIGNSVTTIGDEAFRNCTGFTGDLTIPNSVTTIGGSAFAFCSGFTGGLAIGNSVTTIGSSAFYGCIGFTGSLTIGNSVTTIGGSAFYACSGLTGDLTIPNSVTLIDDYAFYQCSGFTGSLTIGNSVTTIGGSAFYGCSGLTGDLTIPNSVTLIDDYAFYQCSGFTGSLTLGNSLTTIEAGAFAECSGFTGSLTLGNSVSEIGLDAFAYCSGFTAINSLVVAPPTLGDDAFYEVNPAIPVTVPCGSLGAYQAVTGWNTFTNWIDPCSHEITATADPSVGGTVSGGGTYTSGQSCTLTATPAAGYTFVNWTKGSTVVSTNANYTFTVTEAGTYVAHFEQNSYTITATATPAAGGTVSGGGTYNHGASCTLTATPAAGYTFAMWTNDGTVVSISATYTFTVAGDATYVAHFEPIYPLRYAINSDGVSVQVTGHVDGTAATGPITIPETKIIDGVTYTVTGIGDYAFEDCVGLTGDLTIPNSVTAIGQSAFSSCSGFTSLILSNSLTTIGRHAFYNCSGLTGSLTIPNSVMMIGESAFSGCSGLTGSLTIPNTVTTIGEYTFYQCSGFTGDLTIPNSVTTIGGGAFAGCSGFTGDLIIPNAVTTIGWQAFSGCSGFTGSLNIPNSVTTIGNDAFWLCSGLTGDLILPNSVITIGDAAFAGCTGFTSLTLGNSMETIEEFAFENCTGLTAIHSLAVAPPTLGDDVFYDVNPAIPVTVPCGSLDDYQAASGWDEFTNWIEACSYTITATADPAEGGTVSGGSTYTGGQSCTLTATPTADYSFVHWMKDGTIVSTDATYTFTVTGNATYVAHFEFVDPDPLTYAINSDGVSVTVTGHRDDTDATGPITIPETKTIDGVTYTVTAIGDYAFYHCSGLTGSLTIPNSVIEIGNYAFWLCTGFTGSLTLGNSLTTIGESAFDSCIGFTGSLTIPNSVIEIGNYAFWHCSGFTGSLTLGNSLTTIEMQAFQYCSGFTGSLTIPNSVTTIGMQAFDGCSGFTGSLTLGSSLTTIGESAFDSCSGFTGSLTIPNSVTTIGNSAFDGCSGFTGSLTIPNSVTAIGPWAFAGCSGFTGSLTIPNSVTTIGEGVFDGCSGFTGSLTLGNSVTVIEGFAFYGCSGFTGSLTIPNSVTTIGAYAFDGCSGFTAINSLAEAPPTLGYGVFHNVDSAIPVTVPCGSLGAYQAASGWDVFTNWIEPCPHEITATANPAAGGTITGAGTYDHGTSCTLTATANTGYTFVNWTEGGVQASTNATYTFEVTTDRILVANFTASSYIVSATANPSAGGTVTGAGGYNYGESCTLTATANTGYTFVNWTEGGTQVSTNAAYTFNVTGNRTLVANFTQNNYTITVTADPSAGGAVSGDGTYNHGASCTLTATANAGYTFVNWTKGGSSVSTNANYTFTVTETGAYVAHFEQNSYTITVTANPSAGGTVSGAGGYNYGESCTLTATANIGYTFVNWTESGAQISTNAAYTFEVTTDRILVANFTQDSYTITATANPAAGGTVSGGGTYNYGESCTLTATPNAGYLFVNWTKDGSSVSTNATYTFTVTEAGSYVANFIEPSGSQTNNFTSGWNWWNTYIGQESIDGLTQLEECLGSNGIQIKSQAQYVNYYEGMGWMGMLSNINNESSYKIKTSAACVVEMTGEATTSASHPITIGPGWNWIGYPVNSSMSVGTALSGITPANGDQLKALNGYANYYNGMGWMGTLSTIEPGMGLLYKSNGSGSFTLVYPEGAKGETLVENISSDNNHWVPDMHAYPDNMTVTAIVKLDDEELTSDSYELAAFANGECRGSVRLMYIEPLDRYIAFLTITGEEVETLSFSLYDMVTGEEVQGANEQINFSNNATLGDLMEPYAVHFRDATSIDEWAHNLYVYPNPVAKGQLFSLVSTKDEIGEMQIEIINALGVVVETLPATSAQTIAAPDVAGVYTLRITVEGKGTCYRKLVVR